MPSGSSGNPLICIVIQSQIALQTWTPSRISRLDYNMEEIIPQNIRTYFWTLQKIIQKDAHTHDDNFLVFNFTFCNKVILSDATHSGNTVFYILFINNFS